MAQELAPIIRDPGPEAGPAMAQLTPLQRRFVMAMLERGDLSQAACAKMAGSTASTPDSLRNAGVVLANNPKVKAAIHEQAEMRLGSAKIAAVSGLLQIATGPSNDATKLKAILAILNRTGFHEVSEHHVVTTNMNDELESDLDQLAHWAEKTNTKLAPEFQRLVDARRKKVSDVSQECIQTLDIDPDEDILGRS